MDRIGQPPVPWNLRYANNSTAEDVLSDGICEGKHGGTISPRTPPDTNWTYCEVPKEMTSKMRMIISARGRTTIVNKQVTEHGTRGTAPERASKRASEPPPLKQGSNKKSRNRRQVDGSSMDVVSEFAQGVRTPGRGGVGFEQTRRSKGPSLTPNKPVFEIDAIACT